MKTLKNIIVLISILITFNTNAQEDKRTPFAAVQYEGNQAYFLYNDQWVEIVSIEDISIKTYIEKAQEDDPTDWKRGFHRYLHYMMDDMGIVRGETVKVSFVLNQQTITKDIALKIENRDLATDFYEIQLAENRIKRPIGEKFPDSLLYLRTRMDGYEKIEENWFSQEEAIHDLEYLEWEIKNHFSYAKLRGFDYQLALDIIKSDLDKGISKRDFALQISMFLANFGDGHTRVGFSSVVDQNKEYKWLPFRIMKWNGKYYAVNTETKSYYLSDYPEIVSINGKNIEHYYDIAEQLVAKTTHKFVSSITEEIMQLTAFVMKLAAEDISQAAVVKFSGSTGTIEESIVLDKSKSPQLKKIYHHRDSIINDTIGYIAFTKFMDSDSSFIAMLHQSMQKMKNTQGLIVDIRGNGGGSRAPLVALLPYFIKQPTITNVARYRINANEDLHPKNGYLLKRFSYPLSYDGYTDDERQTISAFAKDFQPAIIPSDDEFTDYHYMVISPTTENNTYYYDKPVLVLVDEGCFSASDIFAAGIRQGDNVSLLGNRTGGGSGFSKKVILPNSEIKVKLSRMFSYQPNGQMYDGHGVIPDIIIDYTFDDKLGITDSQLQRALKELVK